MKRVAVFGTGYVGCVTAACLARDGHRVVGVDIDSDKVAAINGGRAPVSEPGLEEFISAQVASGVLSATSDVAPAIQDTKMTLICVGTPSMADGAVRTVAVEGVIESIGRALRETSISYVVILLSTLLPGILEDRLAPRLSASASRALGPELRLCNNPEFLRESSAIKDYDHPPFVVIGTTDDGGAKSVLDLYGALDAPKVVTAARTPALVKYTRNAFHTLKVAFANEIGCLAKSFGGNGHEVMRLVCQDDKLNISPAYLKPGFAFCGSCLPKDLRALVHHAQQQAVRVPLLEGILPSNEQHLDRAAKLIQQSGQRNIGLVGMSFKAGTGDLRESPQVILAETLLDTKFNLRIYDPGVAVSRLRGRNLAYVDQHLPHLAPLLVDDPEALFKHSQVLLLATAVADQVPWQASYRGQIIDLRRDLTSAG